MIAVERDIALKRFTFRAYLRAIHHQSILEKYVDVSRMSAYKQCMGEVKTIQLRQFCELFNVEHREVRYILEQGYIPKGVMKSPSTGNRREFQPDHALWLGIVLKLKQVGIRTPLAAMVAERAVEGMTIFAQLYGWDYGLFPFKGRLDADQNYFMDIGDLTCIRFVFDVFPTGRVSRDFRIRMRARRYLGWQPVDGSRCPVQDFEPFVTLRVDLLRIIKLLNKYEPWSASKGSQI
ncbi:hypothetical protein DTL21_10845 [Bremerella cremea]|uniref:Uncharacterized protein n=1 Tax=Blastopirellula marina TaxID=124 RepID=A0A2S8FW25_9BACT|nr:MULTISPECIES: hypothetical protein [Pirellulaceae]PQO36386.1 hypothetical protein C5Y83_10840 [Blastopirellula marina]RCS49064.1 hypothetical protein DTL21_10845 [Bremerella cremea]